MRHNRGEGGVQVSRYAGGSVADLLCAPSKLPLLGQSSDVSPEALVLEVGWQSK